jgi:hypothetical protein
MLRVDADGLAEIAPGVADAASATASATNFLIYQKYQLDKETRVLAKQ